MAAAQQTADFRPGPTRFSLLVNRFERLAGRVRDYFDRHGPGLALYVLSPVVAELVLGSSPPLVFLLFGWVDLLMYGGGAVIIRELVRRWGKGWPSILALGVAYGIAEEGLAIRSFFNPDWSGAAGLQGYGFVGGLNWFWATEMAVYHSVVSITLPILLVSLAYPARRGQPWIPGGSLARVVVGFLASILVCWAILPFAVSGGALLGCLAAMAVCYVVARSLPARVSWPAAWTWVRPGLAPQPGTVFRLSLAVTVLSFVVVFSRGFGLPFGIAAVLLVAMILAMAAWLLRAAAGRGWGDRHRMAIPAGVIAFFVGFSPFVELSGGHGQIVVGLVTAVVLRRVWLSLAASAPIDVDAVSRDLRR
ncbi:MAG: hypothetical protein ABSD62_04525 [Candidatus Limnocylindrales bacterium]|jgi:hypothetical protein